MGNGMPCWGKTAPYVGETVSILLGSSFIELPESNLKSLGKARNLLTFQSMPKLGKTNMNHDA